MTLLAVFLLVLFLYCLVSAELAKTPITAPILFTVAGILAGLIGGTRTAGPEGLEVFLSVAEVGLVMLLFTDASRTDLPTLRTIASLPARLLGIGMPLTILLGGLAAKLVYPEFSLWDCGILAAILAPTDAGLGQVIVESPAVPVRIRQALNVEAGLNDGLSVPFLLFFLAMAASSDSLLQTHGRFARFAVEQLGFGLVLGLAVGLAGGWLIARAERRRRVTHSLVPIAMISLPLLCIVGAEAIDASMFIAAFVAGLVVQIGFKSAGKFAIEFTEGWGQLLNLSVFFLFGMIMTRSWSHLDGRSLVYALLSLTVVRLVPVAISLIGTRLGTPTVVFMGWFGPRGLASIVLGLVYLQRVNRTAIESPIALAIMMTVGLSIFLHGLSASPGISLYARLLGSKASKPAAAS